MTEFPAAHSMDTTWFAIDSDGHIAIFESGESGCVPADAYRGEEVGDTEDQLHALPSTGVVHDLAGLRAIAVRDHLDPAHLYAPFDILAFVNDLAPPRDLVARVGAEPCAATTGAALRFKGTERAALEDLHARGLCLGCFQIPTDERGDVAAHGAYRYEHTCDNWIAGPYARTTIPAQPIGREALPDLGKVVRYTGRFAEAQKLQPAELWPCESWEPGWLASDGKTVHPFEGREADYARQVEELREIDTSLVFLDAPPSGPPRSAPRAGEPPKATQLSPRKPWWKFW